MWKETFLPTKCIFGTVAVTFSLWCRKGKALCERPFALYRQQPEMGKQMSTLPINGKISVKAYACVVYVYNVTSALYCAINNHFCVPSVLRYSTAMQISEFFICYLMITETGTSTPFSHRIDSTTQYLFELRLSCTPTCNNLRVPTPAPAKALIRI